MTIRRCRWLIFLVPMVLLLAVTAWVVVGEIGLRASDADRLAETMTYEEVVAALGRPADEEGPEGPGIYRYAWETLDGWIVVRFDRRSKEMVDINSGIFMSGEKFWKRHRKRLGLET